MELLLASVVAVVALATGAAYWGFLAKRQAAGESAMHASGTVNDSRPSTAERAKKTDSERMLVKSNSTSSVYAESSISAPRQAELFRCVAAYARRLIDDDLAGLGPVPHVDLEILDERRYPLDDADASNLSIPSVDEIEMFLADVYSVDKHTPESVVMGITYLDRVQAQAALRMQPHTWRRLLLSCLILSAKVWEDDAVYNGDFIEQFPRTTRSDLSQLEKLLLSLLDFDVVITYSQYAKTYFEIRSQARVAGDNFVDLNGKPVKPLDEAGQIRLHKRTSEHAGRLSRHHRRAPRHTISFDSFHKLTSDYQPHSSTLPPRVSPPRLSTTS